MNTPISDREYPGALTDALRALIGEKREVERKLAAVQNGSTELSRAEDGLAGFRAHFERYGELKAEIYNSLKQALDSPLKDPVSQFGPDLVGLMTLGLGDENEDIRHWCKQYLGNNEDAAALPGVLCALRHGSPEGRRAAAMAIALSVERYDAKPNLAALIAALGDPDKLVRWHICLALGRVGPAANEAVPALRKTAASDLDSDVAAEADSALRKISGRNGS